MTAIITHTKWGPMLVPPYDVYLSQAMIRFGEYAPSEFATWAPYIPKGGIVVDVGANIGCHTLPFAHAVGPVGTVYAVEPQRALAYMLSGSLALNNIRHVHVKHCAFGKAFSECHIPALDYATENNFGGLDLNKFTEGESVPIVPLDAWSLDRVDFLKVDVEGMELDVLEGAQHTITTCRPIISVEADRQGKADPLIAWLTAHEYDLWWHTPPLGALWPQIASTNLLGIPAEIQADDPTGDVRPAA